MPAYEARITEGSPIYTRLDLRSKWLAKHEGEWIWERLDPVSKAKDPKTKAQLGLYWGFWLPEIWRQLKKDGHTVTIEFREFKREIPITKAAAHEVVTGVCGYVGDDGEHIRLSGADKFDGIRWLTNVLDFAGELRMNTDEMKATAKRLKGDSQ